MPDVRQTVRYVYENGQRGILNLSTPTAPDPKLVDKVVEILKQGNPDSQAVVLPLLAALPENSVWEQQVSVQDALRSMLEQKPKAEKLCGRVGCGFVLQEPHARAQATSTSIRGTAFLQS